MKVWVATWCGEVVGVFGSREAVVAYEVECKKINAYPEFDEWDVDELAGDVAVSIYTVHVLLENPECVSRHAVTRGVRHPTECVTGELRDGSGYWLWAESPTSYEDAERAALERREEWLRSQA